MANILAEFLQVREQDSDYIAFCYSFTYIVGVGITIYNAFLQNNKSSVFGSFVSLVPACLYGFELGK